MPVSVLMIQDRVLSVSFINPVSAGCVTTPTPGGQMLETRGGRGVKL